MDTYKVADCFREQYFSFRDPELGRRFKAELPVLSGDLSNWDSKEDDYVEMAEAVLGVRGKKKSVKELKKLLVEQGKTCSLQQIDLAILRFENWEKRHDTIGDDVANIFFVCSGRDVVILLVHHDGEGWNVSRETFDDVACWHAHPRVFYRG